MKDCSEQSELHKSNQGPSIEFQMLYSLKLTQSKWILFFPTVAIDNSLFSEMIVSR